VNDDCFEISDLAEITEVDRFGSDPEFPQNFVVQRWGHSHSYAALWGATRKREMGEGRCMVGRGELF
jgi:hypothetical protein